MSEPIQPAVQLKNVALELGGREILRDITLDFPDRAFTVIFGPNGAGKTTLLKVLIGQLNPSSGTVRVLGRTVEESLPLIGYVPQRHAYRRDFPITVLKTVLMGRYGRLGWRRPGRDDLSKAEAALKTVGLDGFGNRYLADLSGGQLQRVLIARALAGEPRILLLDEASAAVDAGAKEGLFALLERLKQEMAVIFVTHDMSVISKGVDLVLCLDRRLISHGRPDEALSAHALECMYGSNVAAFAHCGAPHMHAEPHDE